MAAIRNNIAVSLTSEAEEENLELNRKKRLRLLNKKQKYHKQQQNLLRNDKKNGKTTQLCEVIIFRGIFGLRDRVGIIRDNFVKGIWIRTKFGVIRWRRRFATK